MNVKITVKQIAHENKMADHEMTIRNHQFFRHKKYPSYESINKYNFAYENINLSKLKKNIQLI